MEREKKKSSELLTTHAQICEVKQQKGTGGTNCFRVLSLQLLPDSNPIILTLSGHTKQYCIPKTSIKAKVSF